MIYFDTSYILKCYLNEPGCEKVRDLAQNSKGLCSSILAKAEFYSGLCRHYEEKRIKKYHFEILQKLFLDDTKNRIWTWLPLDEFIISKVLEIYRTFKTEKLRSADAIHIATAIISGAGEIYSNDLRMLKSADAIGLTGVNVLN